VLVTDYSSVMWDFSFSKKPIFLFAPDINDYEVKRGFYIPPEEWPFPIAMTNDEIANNIRDFDQSSYLKLVSEHLASVGSYEKGNACEKVKSIIDKHLSSIGVKYE